MRETESMRSYLAAHDATTTGRCEAAGKKRAAAGSRNATDAKIASGRFVAFDVETPNSRNDRMSAIGITVIEDGEITDEFYSLVNPETRFDPFNIALTGISPADVEYEPTFRGLWDQLEPILSDGILVAHNASFDLGVLAKCLRAYEIPWQETVRYACTVRISRQMHPETENHRLNTMCELFDIALDHHHAGSDSHACGEILLHCLEEGAEIGRFIRTYDLRTGRTLQRKSVTIL